jgi:hypothetical protein
MKALRFVVAAFLLGLSMAASAQSIPTPRFEELERKLQIRPEQKEQFDMAVGATKRALLAVGLSAMEMKQRLAEELMKAHPDFSQFFDGADRVFEQNRPLFEEAAGEWKKLYGLLDDRQVQVVKQFLLDNLGQFGAAPFMDEGPRKKPVKPADKPTTEWI